MISFLRFCIAVSATAAAIGCIAAGARAASLADGKSGALVYQEVCLVCHSTRESGAPRYGNRAAWAPLLAQGQAAVTAQAWIGVGEMPPQGGDKNLSPGDFARAAAFMARAAGADWQDPDAALLAQIAAEVQKRNAEPKGAN
jgi:cytochrome c5